MPKWSLQLERLAKRYRNDGYQARVYGTKKVKAVFTLYDNITVGASADSPAERSMKCFVKVDDVLMNTHADNLGEFEYLIRRVIKYKEHYVEIADAYHKLLKTDEDVWIELSEHLSLAFGDRVFCKGVIGKLYFFLEYETSTKAKSRVSVQIGKDADSLHRGRSIYFDGSKLDSIIKNIMNDDDLALENLIKVKCKP